jgi:hypothetical protein
MKPEVFADNFINKFAPKRVGGAEMRKYLIGRFQRAMEIARKDGYDEGKKEQKIIEVPSRGVSYRELAKSFKINERTLGERRARGWDIREALTDPVKTEHNWRR